jgi:hypothetical protein
MCEAIGNGEGMRRALRRVALEHHDGDLAVALLWLENDPRNPAEFETSAEAHLTAARDLGVRIKKVARIGLEAGEHEASSRVMGIGQSRVFAGWLADLAVALLRTARDLERLAERAEVAEK